MRLLIDARSLDDKPSGIGIYVYNMAKSLLEKKNMKIYFVTDILTGDKITELHNEGIEILEYGKRVKKTISLFGYYKFVQRCIHEIKPNIFWEANNLVPIKIQNPYGKLMATIHDMFPLQYPGYYEKIYPIYFKYGISQTLKYFDAIIYNSKETQNETIKYFNKAKNKPSIIAYSIVDRLQSINKGDDDSFFYVGNIEKRKGADLLIRAFALYKQKGGKKKLKLAGNIRESAIRELVTQLNEQYPNDFTYMGYIGEEEKINTFSSCFAFIFPSIAEGFGVPVIEAMSYNKPILASNLSIFKELVENSITYIDMVGRVPEQQVQNIASSMLELEDKYEAPEELKKRYQFYLDRFSSARLGECVYEYFKQSIQEK